MKQSWNWEVLNDGYGIFRTGNQQCENLQMKTIKLCLWFLTDIWQQFWLCWKKMDVTLMVRRLVDILTFVIYIWRGDMKMIDMYLALVMNDMRTCDENNKTLPLVPKKYRVKVMECLTALGLDANGDPIA